METRFFAGGTIELGLVTAKPSACLPVEADEPHFGHDGIDQEVLLQPVLPSPASKTTGKAQVRKREVTAMAEESFPTLITDFLPLACRLQRQSLAHCC